MKEYIEWLENRIDICLEDKDLQREHWAFCQALIKMRELQLLQPAVRACACRRPLPVTKCSENGIFAYCTRCCKEYLPQTH